MALSFSFLYTYRGQCRAGHSWDTAAAAGRLFSAFPLSKCLALPSFFSLVAASVY